MYDWPPSGEEDNHPKLAWRLNHVTRLERHVVAKIEASGFSYHKDGKGAGKGGFIRTPSGGDKHGDTQPAPDSGGQVPASSSTETPVTVPPGIPSSTTPSVAPTSSVNTPQESQPAAEQPSTVVEVPESGTGNSGESVVSVADSQAATAVPDANATVIARPTNRRRQRRFIPPTGEDIRDESWRDSATATDARYPGLRALVASLRLDRLPPVTDWPWWAPPGSDREREFPHRRGDILCLIPCARPTCPGQGHMPCGRNCSVGKMPHRHHECGHCYGLVMQSRNRRPRRRDNRR